MSEDLLEDAIRAQLRQDATAAPNPARTQQWLLELPVGPRRSHARMRRWGLPLLAAASVLIPVFTVVAIRWNPTDTHTRAPAADSGQLALAGTTWQLVSFSESGGPTESTATLPAVATIVFDGRGKYHFFDGCNDAGGFVKITHDSISMGPGAITDVACQASNMQAIQRVMARIAGGTSAWSIANVAGQRTLTLLTPGHNTLQFEVKN